ncbi:uroporphyrinogen decarboxylase family protein [Thermatribacter velox]|uniref:Uroporphyrinogen decarboxylase family protein n=1 Tax=Thermatribacter velox TaxID=3039681 RepID=A0ABZ2YCL0_9BACT
MTPRERALRALEHKVPDRIPLDLGSTNCTTMTRVAYENLKSYLGIEGETRLMMENFQIVFIDEAVLEYFQIDTRGVHPQPVFQKTIIDERTYKNEFGIVYRMPENGLYYDMVEHPLAGKSLEELEDYPWPDPAKSMNLEGLREKTQKMYEEGKYLLVGDMIDTGIFEPCWYLRGFENFLVDLLINKDFALKLMEGMYNYQLNRYSLFLKEVGEFLDVIFVGDDLATAENVIMSPETYRELIKPFHKEYFRQLKKLAPRAKLLYHSCGSILQFIPDLIEIGVDILNPVQVSAQGMEPAILKERFGRELSFWGAIDTTFVLPRGTREEVRQEVRTRIDQLGPEGYVLTSVHDIQPDVPPENVIAMFEEARAYGCFSVKEL